VPLSAVQSLSESIPTVLVTGIILMGGWLYENSSEDRERLARLEARQEVYETDVREIKDAIIRVEQFIVQEHLNE